MEITLDNIEQFSVPLKDHPLRWIFGKSDSEFISEEFADQIIPLSREATWFLSKFLRTQRVLESPEYFRTQDRFVAIDKNGNEVREWLHNLGIPYQQKVFWISGPDHAFVLTWKMVIRSSDGIFRNNELIWDRTLNWMLQYDHNEVFCFGKDRIYDADSHSEDLEKMRRLINDAIEEGKKRKL